MNSRKVWIFLALVLFTAIPVLQAQVPPPVPPPKSDVQSDPIKPKVFYRLDCAIREMDGTKEIAVRNYSLWLQTGTVRYVRAATEVATVVVDTKSTAPSADMLKSTRAAMKNIGVSISAIVRETDGLPWLEFDLNLSDAVPSEKGGDPVLRNISINSQTLIILGKPTTVGIAEDPASKRRFQVEVTTTKLK